MHTLYTIYTVGATYNIVDVVNITLISEWYE